MPLDNLRTDLRYAVRTARKSMLVTFVAIASLAAGIGANSAIFSIVNGTLLRPRAVSHPEELVEVYAGYEHEPYQTTTYPTYLDLRQRSDVFTDLAAYSVGWQFRVSDGEDVEQVWGEVVSGNYFDVLGVRATLGRTFLAEEDSVPGRNPVVIIGHGLWQRRFGADPGVIGRTITVNRQPLTVVGVAPPQYTGMLRGLAADLWIPAMTVPLIDPANGANLLAHRGSSWVTLVGRLRPGVSLEQARAQFALLADQLRAVHPEEWRSETESGTREKVVTLVPERDTRVHPSLKGVALALAGLLLVVVNLLLLVAGLNLAGTLLARAVARRNEIAIRLALGADRRRIVRQLLTESVLLSVVAGIAGIGLALWGLDLLLGFMPPLPEGVRIALDVSLDWRVVLYTLGLATVTGALLGLAPALHATTASVADVLRAEASGATSRSRRSRGGAFLIVTQVAASVLLLIGAGLVLRSLDNVRPTSLGFRAEHVVVAPVSLDETTYDSAATHAFYERLSARVAALPGVQSVTLVDGMPGGFMSRARRGITIEGSTLPPDQILEVDASVVGPGYFTNMGVPIVAGRDFDVRDRDGAPCAAIINEAFARTYFAGAASVLGRRLVRASTRPENRVACEIVGVVRDDAWQRLNESVRPFFSLSLFQAEQRRVNLLVNTIGAPSSLVSAVRAAIRALDPLLPVGDVQTLGGHFSAMLYPFRLLAIVIGSCGVLALLLATLGIYGVVAYSVAQRRREVGIRMALGAVRGDVLRLVVGQGMRPVAYGATAGLLLAALATGVLAKLPGETQLLFGVSPRDALTFVGVTVLLALVALAACWVPARGAARVDPMVTLRDS